MKPSVYIETSIISYLTARPSNDIRSAARQNSTADWWENHSSNFSLFVSEYVLAEAAGGNAEAAERRLKAVHDVPVLETTSLVLELAEKFLRSSLVPSKAELDAYHISVAAAHGMEYLLTWNCKHIANAAMRLKIEEICIVADCEPPVICTPDELMQE